MSEIKLQCELDLPRRARCQRKAEAGLAKLEWSGLCADRAKLSKQIIYMIQHIEELRAEFEFLLFADGELFHRRGIPRLVSRTLDNIASGVAKGSKVRVVGKSAGIEKRSLNARLGIGIADQVGARTIVAHGAAAISAGDIVNIRSGVVIAGGGGSDA